LEGFAQETPGGNQQFREEAGELQHLSTSDVHDCRGQAMERGCASGCLDDSQPKGYSASNGTQPQKRERSRQQTGESRTPDPSAEHSPRDPRIGQDRSTSEDERRQADTRSSVRGSQSLRPEGDGAERDSEAVRSESQFNRQHSQPQDLEIYPRVDWVIIGGESGPHSRPFDVQWARDTIAQFRAAGVPVFVKQMGSKPTTDHRTRPKDEGAHWTTLLKDKKGGNPDEWPADLRVREFPEVAK